MLNSSRQILRVDGISVEMKEALKNSAKEIFGKENTSELVRKLIVDHLLKGKSFDGDSIKFKDEEKTKRVELRLPESVVNEIERRAEQRFSDRNYFIKSLIFSELGNSQLQGDEIETLRKSNYELSKIGTNLNQIAKAFNVLIQMKGGDKMPEVGKRIATLRKELTSHTNKVLKVLESKTKVHETKGRLKKSKNKNKLSGRVL